ncbi:MAG: Ivy family c-type lysozyme inhibitor [Burkholderiaceae bacterium]|nr:Ivy family c-type lysozyme inhibitor [Burkholderiaceae bacterium]
MACLSLAAAAAAATARLDDAALTAYGGEFAVDCADPRQPRLRVTAEALIVEHGGGRSTAAPVQAMPGFYGSHPPPGYLVALSAPLSQRGELLLVLFRDARGRYLRIDGDEKVRAALGRRFADAPYRDCEAASAARDGRAWAAEQRDVAAAQAASPLRDARFRAAFERALGARAGEPWIQVMVGQTTTPEMATLAGARYALYSVCKPHDCGDHQLLLLFSSERGEAFGRLRENGRSPRWLGNPPAALQPEIDRLFRQQWPAGPTRP